MELEKEAFKKMFPKLAQELGSGENKVSVNSVRTDNEAGERHVTRETFVHYVPDVIDFIRRCDTQEQAEQIIDYVEKRGEIDGVYAQKLKMQLKEKGVRSFGAKKEGDYYLKRGEL
ncbi:MAG TPA: DUF2095 family protein [Candidatus Acidoferrales bacterium]|nr:DUF2095 family protein [Candidatus Acidoferrales bacterium]